MKNAVLEALCVAIAGAVIAFGANAISPRGLSLTRDYFAVPSANPQSLPSGTDAAIVSAGTNGLSRESVVAEDLRKAGLQAISGEHVLKLFHDERAQQGLVIFIDARKDREYQNGHIPGALQFDYYHPENYLAPVLTACGAAQEIVVYCSGGKCEDSKYATLMLRDQGNVPGEKLFVFTGGFTEWKEKGNPLELGERNSGKMRDESSHP